MFRLEAPVLQWIYGIKSHARFDHVALLAALMASSCPPPAAPLALLVPVPLYRGRLRRRGYNQALELTRRLGRQRHLDWSDGAVRQLRPTRDLTQLSRAARRREVRGAFAAAAEQVHNRHIILVDDVLTTGATAEEISRSCLSAGAASVEVWAVARTS